LWFQSFMAKGEYAKASKFFEKSLRLYPLPGMYLLLVVICICLSRYVLGVRALKEKVDKLAADPPSSSSANKGGASHSAPNNSNSGSNNHNSAPSVASEGGSGRSYTPEQESGAKKILQLSKKSHYEVRCGTCVVIDPCLFTACLTIAFQCGVLQVLGIERRATEAEIKKAYRKLVSRGRSLQRH
jgi:hypothetical protein